MKSLKELRTSMKLTRKEVSELSGLEVGRIFYIENHPGDATCEEAQLLCKVYNCTIDYIDIKVQANEENAKYARYFIKSKIKEINDFESLKLILSFTEKLASLEIN